MEKKDSEKLNIDHTLYETKLSSKYLSRKPYAPEEPGKIVSFIPGTILEVKVKAGDVVSSGQEVMVLNAMKMKNVLKSHMDGKVLSVNVSPGDKVAKGVVLLVIG